MNICVCMYVFFSTINSIHFLCDCLPERVHNWMNKIFYSILFIYLFIREREREIKVRFFEFCVLLNGWNSPHLNMIFHVQVFLIIFKPERFKRSTPDDLWHHRVFYFILPIMNDLPSVH